MLCDWVSLLGEDLVAFGMEDEKEGGGGADERQAGGVIWQDRGRDGAVHEEVARAGGGSLREAPAREGGGNAICKLEFPAVKGDFPGESGITPFLIIFSDPGRTGRTRASKATVQIPSRARRGAESCFPRATVPLLHSNAN